MGGQVLLTLTAAYVAHKFDAGISCTHDVLQSDDLQKHEIMSLASYLQVSCSLMRCTR